MMEEHSHHHQIELEMDIRLNEEDHPDSNNTFKEDSDSQILLAVSILRHALRRYLILPMGFVDHSDMLDWSEFIKELNTHTPRQPSLLSNRKKAPSSSSSTTTSFLPPTTRYGIRTESKSHEYKRFEPSTLSTSRYDQIFALSEYTYYPLENLLHFHLLLDSDPCLTVPDSRGPLLAILPHTKRFDLPTRCYFHAELCNSQGENAFLINRFLWFQHACTTYDEDVVQEYIKRMR